MSENIYIEITPEHHVFEPSITLHIKQSELNPKLINEIEEELERVLRKIKGVIE
jgi:type III secretory pathway lipoprotein EscJ